MNAHEWWSSRNPVLMLDALHGTASERKMRLFVVACAYLVWDLLPAGAMRNAVEIAERLADGLTTEEDRLSILDILHKMPVNSIGQASDNYLSDRSMVELSPYFAALTTVGRFDVSASRLTSRPSWQQAKLATAEQQPDLLRDIFGNPFRRVSIDPHWVSPEVVDLARSIYEQKAFDRMPALADLLQNAGCDSEAILHHCRTGGPHVRGCWVVDLILGKS